MNKLALGGVQFGLDYGINNPQGKVPKNDVFDILALAKKSGIDLIDTADTYGDSETVIGEYLSSRPDSFKIVTKTRASGQDDVADHFRSSIKALRAKSLYGYLIHDFKAFKETPEIWVEMKKLKDDKLVKKIGFSLYFPHEIDFLFDNNIAPGILQFPYSIFDQRFSPYLKDLKDKGIEIHVRSVFLQGLLLMDPAQLPVGLKAVKEKLQYLNLFSKEKSVPLSSVCLNFAVLNPDIDRVVIGVNSCKELNEGLGSGTYADKCREMMPILSGLGESNEDIILPTNWKEKRKP